MATRAGERAPRRRGANGSSGRRAELLQIAARLFATQGYAQTTVRDIGDEAGMLSGSLYHHFASKETMLTEILRDLLGGLRQRFGEIVEERSSPREAFDGLVVAAFESIHHSRHAVALYQNEAALLASSPDFAFVAELGAEVERLWLGVLQAGVDSGDFRADLDLKITYSFLRDGIWSSVRWYDPDGRLRHDSLAAQFLTLVHGGLLAD